MNVFLSPHHLMKCFLAFSPWSAIKPFNISFLPCNDMLQITGDLQRKADFKDGQWETWGNGPGPHTSEPVPSLRSRCQIPLGLTVSLRALSTSLSVHPVELVLGICEVVWGGSIVLGTYLSVLLSEVSLPPLTLVCPHPITWYIQAC